MITILKQIGIALAILVGLQILGATINSYITWSYLTGFFSMLKAYGNLFSFMWDTTTLWTLLGITFLLQIAYWTFKAIMFGVSFFKKS